jgi:hypothetical protein
MAKCSAVRDALALIMITHLGIVRRSCRARVFCGRLLMFGDSFCPVCIDRAPSCFASMCKCLPICQT